MNFQRQLMELMREARWLGRLGIDIPEAAQLILPQDEKFRSYNHKLTHLLLVPNYSIHRHLRSGD